MSLQVDAEFVTPHQIFSIDRTRCTPCIQLSPTFSRLGFRYYDNLQPLPHHHHLRHGICRKIKKLKLWCSTRKKLKDSFYLPTFLTQRNALMHSQTHHAVYWSRKCFTLMMWSTLLSYIFLVLLTTTLIIAIYSEKMYICLSALPQTFIPCKYNKRTA